MQADRNQPQEGSVTGQLAPNGAINRPVDPSTMDSSAATPAEASNLMPGGAINQVITDELETTTSGITVPMEASNRSFPDGAINQPVEPLIVGSSAMAQPEASNSLTSSAAVSQQSIVGDSSATSRSTAQPENDQLSSDTVNQPVIDQPRTTASVDVGDQATPPGGEINRWVSDELGGTITPPHPPSNLEKHLENENKFKTELKNKNFFEAFASVVKDVVQLEILTLVEDEVDLNHQSLDDIEGEPGKRMVTIVNLLNGDIKNIIGSRFVENNAYAQLRDYHSEQVIKSHQIIKDNLDCLYTAIKDLIEIYKEDKAIKEEDQRL